MTEPLNFTSLCKKLAVLAGPFFYERSLKIDPESVNADRCLLTWPRESLGAGAAAKYRGLLQELGFAPEAIDALDRVQKRAQFLHFGLEGSPTAPKMKAYVEFEPEPAHNALRYLAVKSAPGSSSEQFVISEYRQHAYQHEGQRRLDGLSRTIPQCLQDLESVLAEVFTTAPERCDLLQVCDLGTNRVSFDWNIARAGVEHAVSVRLLGAAQEFFGLHHDLSVQTSALARIEVLNHIAIGLSHSEQPFLTLYHDAEEWGDMHEFTDRRLKRFGLAE